MSRAVKTILVLAFACVGFACQPEPQLITNVGKIPCPSGFERVQCNDNSACRFLRDLELKTDNNTVFLYNGSKKWPQDVHFAVLKIDVGTRDLQQCADACMRLRGEYLFQQERLDDIHFNFLGDGKPHYFKEYAKGDYSHQKFRKYMDYVFAYANTASLRDELKPTSIENIKPGDVFIQKGSPYGHAITVMDLAEDPTTGKKLMLLSQSYMPAQEIHILKNPNNVQYSPWYEVDFGDVLVTPEWTFNKTDLRSFE